MELTSERIPSSTKEIGTMFEEKFDPTAYLETYYSDKPDTIDTENKIINSLKAIQEQLKNNHNVIDLQDIAKIAHLQPTETEDIEHVLTLDFQIRIAQKLLEVYPQDKIDALDVGGGPTIYQHMIICLAAGSIIHSEFLEKNREVVKKWLNNDEDSFNWDAYFVLVKKMLKNDQDFQNILKKQLQDKNGEVRSHAKMIENILISSSITEFKQRLRESIGNKIVYGNVFHPDLGLAESNKRYDMVTGGQEGGVELITSNFCIESATSEKSHWEKGIKNIIAKVKPNGYLALTIIRNANWYKFGAEQFPAVSVNEEDVTKILQDNDCEVLECQVLTGFDRKELGYDGIVMVFAKKN